MSVGTKDLAVDKLDGMDKEKLVDELRKSKEELFNLRFQHATGQLESHGRIRAVKRDISRIYTILRERELGIRADVTSAVIDSKAEKKSSDKPKKTAKKAAAESKAEEKAK